MKIIKEDREAEPDAFDVGTESEEEIEYVVAEKRYDAYSNFTEYHIEYSMSELESVPKTKF